MNNHLWDAFAESAAAMPGKAALITPAGPVSFADLATQVAILRDGLRQAGARSRSRLLVQTGDHTRLFATLLACFAEGIVVIPVSPHAGPEWLATLQTTTGADFLSSTSGAFTRLHPNAPPDLDTDVHTLILTSGSTGKPKGVPIHAAMSNAALSNAVTALGLTSDSVFLNYIPPWSVGGLFLSGLVCLATGCTQIVTGFNPFGFGGTLAQHQPSHTILLPVMINVLRNTERWADIDLSCLETVVCGAAPVSDGLGTAILQRGARRFLHAYGSSECLTPVLVHASTDAAQPGKAVLSRLCGDYTSRLSTEGELLLRGPGVLRGYLGAPPGQGFVDGWFRTGDVFTQDAAGFHFVGRLDSRLKINGWSVVPEVTEAVILDFPGITGCVAVKSDGAGGGEALDALIAAPAPFDSAALRAHCAARLDRHQVPRHFHPVARIPLNAMGKIDRPAASRLPPG